MENYVSVYQNRSTPVLHLSIGHPKAHIVPIYKIAFVLKTVGVVAASGLLSAFCVNPFGSTISCNVCVRVLITVCVLGWRCYDTACTSRSHRFV